MKDLKLEIKQLLEQLEEVDPTDFGYSNDVDTFPLGSVVFFTTDDGTQKIGIVEAKVKETDSYLVRVMATYQNEAGGQSLEPTDEVLTLSADTLDHYETETLSAKNDPIMFQTEGGVVYGYVDDEDTYTYTAEVYMPHENKYEPTRVYVRVPKDRVKHSDIWFAKGQSRLMCEIKNADLVIDNTNSEDTGEIKGLLSSYGNIDSYGDIVEKGAYTQTLNHNGGKTKMFFDHSHSVKDVAGVAYLSDSDEGLLLDGKMPLKNTEIKNAYETMKFMMEHGEPIGLSIGYKAIKKDYDNNGFRRLKEIQLKESTITPFPADFNAKIYEIKSRRMIYLSKKHSWEKILKKSEAPTGIRYTKDDSEFLSLLRELKQSITRK